MDLQTQNREQREELLQLKMEAMKKKNEEILRRHLEIEADKKNADFHSQAVIANKKNNPQPVLPPRERITPSATSKRSTRQQVIQKLEITRDSDDKRKQRLSETEAPPPDPNFNFLSDPLRDASTDSLKISPDKGTRHKNNYGGENFENVRTSMRRQRNFEKENPILPPKTKMERSLRMTGRERKEYDDWKKERERIDEERLARQKMSSGRWRREWDNEKINQDEDIEKPHETGDFYRSPQWDTEPAKINEPKPPPGKGRGRGRGRNRQNSQPDENVPFQRRSSPSHQGEQFNRSNSNSWSSRSPESPKDNLQSNNWGSSMPKTAPSPEIKVKIPPRGRFAQPKRNLGPPVPADFEDYDTEDLATTSDTRNKWDINSSRPWPSRNDKLESSHDKYSVQLKDDLRFYDLRDDGTIEKAMQSSTVPFRNRLLKSTDSAENTNISFHDDSVYESKSIDEISEEMLALKFNNDSVQINEFSSDESQDELLKDRLSLKIEIQNNSWTENWVGSPNGRSFSDSWKEDLKSQRTVSILSPNDKCKFAEGDNNLVEQIKCNLETADTKSVGDDDWEDISSSEEETCILLSEANETLAEAKNSQEPRVIIETSSNQVNSGEIDQQTGTHNSELMELTMTLHGEDSGIQFDQSLLNSS